VYLEQVPEMPNLYAITNLAWHWEAWWRILLAFRGPDYGVIIAGKCEPRGKSMKEDDWNYVTRDDERRPPSLGWDHEFTETEAEDPYVYTNLNMLCRDLLQLSEQPICIRFRPMFWVRSDEGWRVPMRRLVARGIRIYTAVEVEEARRNWEEKLQFWKKHFGLGMGEESP
jgi:hypothetical protein